MEFVTPFSLIFGCFVLGVGYLTIYLFNTKEDYSHLKNYDKIMQSMIIGGLSFGISLKLFVIEDINLESEQEILKVLTNSPTIFILLFLISIGIYSTLTFLKIFLEKEF